MRMSVCDVQVCVCVCDCVCVDVCQFFFVLRALINAILMGMGWLRIVGSLRVSFAEYLLFCRAVLQKRPTILRSQLIVATLHAYARVCAKFICLLVFVFAIMFVSNAHCDTDWCEYVRGVCACLCLFLRLCVLCLCLCLCL